MTGLGAARRAPCRPPSGRCGWPSSTTLFATALRGQQRRRPHPAAVAAAPRRRGRRARDLTARESECCSFFTFTFDRRPADALALDVEVPAAHVDVLDALAGRAAAGRRR